MSYAIIESGGKQFRVTKGQVVRLPLMQAEAGASVEFNPLLRGSGSEIQVGGPILDGAPVRGTVLEQGRGPKIIVFKKKRKKQYKKTIGHRQAFTAVLIESVGVEAESEASAAEKSSSKAAPAVEAEAEPTPVNTQITDVAETSDEPGPEAKAEE